jgi:hypothetical protein
LPFQQDDFCAKARSPYGSKNSSATTANYTDISFSSDFHPLSRQQNFIHGNPPSTTRNFFNHEPHENKIQVIESS